MSVKLFDNTLRDGGNVVGHGFNKEMTVSIIKGLLAAGIQDIECGNCKGLGAYEDEKATEACTDEEYLEIIKPFLSQGRIGMFQGAKRARPDRIAKAAEAGINFLRVGNNAGDGKSSLEAVRMVKDAGLVCRYSLMKAYILPSDALAEEAKMLEAAGVDKISIMDSAGYMYPEQADEYVTALKAAVSIPVTFHGHSNLGLSQANALAAVRAGADEIDCGLLGMARSAGNCSTELAAATLQRAGYLPDVDLYKLLQYEDEELIPAMKAWDYRVAVNPTDLMLGLVGCHSSFLSMFRRVAAEEGVSVLRLIHDVSLINQKNPPESLLREVAAKLK